MGSSIGAWWERLSDVKKALAVILSTVMAGMALGIAVAGVLGTPAVAQEGLDLAKVNADRIDGVESTVQSLDAKLDRVLCFLETSEAGTSGLRCSR